MKKVLGLLMILSTCFISCSSKKKLSLSSKNPNRILNLSLGSSIRSIDPRVGNEAPSSFIIRTLFEGLMRMDQNGQIIPGIAESYEISEDQRTYTFYLRKSLWSNGDPLTAYDFEYAWKKAVDPRYAMTGAFTFYTIKNVEACLQGKVSVDEVGIKAVNDRTLVVELEHPAPYFLSLTTCSTFMPINKRIDLENPNWINGDKDAFTCNGSFLIHKWKKGDSLLLYKNPNYWDAKHVALPGVYIQIIVDAMTAFYMFEKGKLDWFGDPIGQIPPDLLQDQNNRKNLCTKEAFGIFWLFVNTDCYPFNNKNLRKALAYAINRKMIAEHVLQLGETPAMGILTHRFALQTEPYFKDGDVEAARKHFDMALEELGLTKEEFPKIVLSLPARVLSHRINQAVQEQWHEVLGIEIELSEMEWPIHFTKVSKGDYQIGEMQWISWLYDPIYMLETFRLKSYATNMSFWENPQYRHFLDLSDQELDVEKRKIYLREAEATLMEELPVIPLCFSRISFMKNPQLKGVHVSPLKEFDLRWAYFEDEKEKSILVQDSESKKF